jgi:pseudoazurin
MKKLFLAVAITMLTPIPLIAAAHAGEVRIETLNKAGDRRFLYSPEIVRIEPGDTVVFVPTDKGHNTVSIDGMLPDGSGRINIGFNKEGSVALEQPGIYGIKCTPHVGLGMVGLIIVGDPGGSEEIRRVAAKLPPKARQRMEALLARAEG